MKLMRGRREEPGNEANVRSVCALSSSSPHDNAERSSDDGAAALQSSLIDRVPLNCRPTNAQSCVFSSYDVIPGAQGGGGGASAPKAPPPASAPAMVYL